MMGALGLGFTSCTDGNDWETDGSHSRLFGTIASKISVESERDEALDFKNVTATVSFPGPKGADYYIIEVSTDSLHDGIAMGGTEHSFVYGEDKSITASPADIAGLEEDTKYYLRIMSKAASANDSKWVYYNEGKTFKTVAEQLFKELTDRDRLETSIHLSWTPDPRVAYIAYKTGDEETQYVMLDDAAKTTGEYTLENLASATTYEIAIYNGRPTDPGKKRGSLSATTAAPIPEGDYEYLMPDDVEVLNQDIIDNIAQQAQAAAGGAEAYSVTIAIPAEKEIKIHGIDPDNGNAKNIKLPAGMSVTFFGRAGGAAPVLHFVKSLDIEGAHAYIRFDNVQVTDGGCQYLVNQGTDCNITEFSVKNSNFYDFERSIIRTQSSGTFYFSNIIVDNCVFTNMASGNAYSVFYFGTDKTYVGKLELSNSTFNTSQKSFIEASKAPITDGIHITNCTFYNNVASGRYLIDANGQNTNITMTSTILGKSFVETAKGIRTAATIVASDCLRTKDCKYSSNDIKELEKREDLSSTDIFTDPDNGDFTLKINDKVGDPRWYKE